MVDFDGARFTPDTLTLGTYVDELARTGQPRLDTQALYDALIALVWEDGDARTQINETALNRILGEPDATGRRSADLGAAPFGRTIEGDSAVLRAMLYDCPEGWQDRTQLTWAKRPGHGDLFISLAGDLIVNGGVVEDPPVESIPSMCPATYGTNGRTIFVHLEF